MHIIMAMWLAATRLFVLSLRAAAAVAVAHPPSASPAAMCRVVDNQIIGSGAYTTITNVLSAGACCDLCVGGGLRCKAWSWGKPGLSHIPGDCLLKDNAHDGRP